MRLRALMLSVLCLGLSACAPDAPVMSDKDSDAGVPRPDKEAPPVRAEAIDDFIVVRKAGAVSVLRRLDAKPAWSVPQRADDPIVKARLASGSIVTVRRSQTVEVYDLRTGQLRFSKEKVGALGVSWTTLFADSVPCQADCALHGYDLATGKQLWAGPQAVPGKVLVEPGEPPDGKYDPPGEFDGPLRAPEMRVVAVRGADAVMFLDAASGQELSRVPVPEAGMAMGSTSGKVLLEWSAVKDCKLTLIGRDTISGEIAWQRTAGAGQSPNCAGGWRPQITDGLLLMSDPQAQSSKVIDVDTGMVLWGAGQFIDTPVVVSRRAVVTSGTSSVAAYDPRKESGALVYRKWATEVAGLSRATGFVLDFDRLLYVTEYDDSPRGIGWVRDVVTGKRLWWGEGLTPVGVDGDRVIAETPSGEIRLERMVSTG